MTDKVNKYKGITPNQTTVEPDKEVEEVEREKIEPVVKGGVKQKKKGLLERLVVGMIGPDGLPRIGDHILHNIVIPTVMNTAKTSLKTGIDMMFSPDQPPTQYYGGTPVNPYTQYHTTPQPAKNVYSSRQNAYTPPSGVGTGRASLGQSRYNNRVDDYAIPYYEDALEVLARIRELANQYGAVSVSDYYDLIGVDTQYTHSLYGWRPEDLLTVNIRDVRDGFLLVLPPVVEIAK